MPYPEQLVRPMREELTQLGVVELRDPDDVTAAFSAEDGKTVLLVINSVCGCAAGNARPAVRLAMQSDVTPDAFYTVFAGQDLEATARVRDFLPGIPPSSPFIVLFQSGEPVFVLERRHIEGRSSSAIAMDLVTAFETYCAADSGEFHPAEGQSTGDGEVSEDNPLPPTFRSIL